MPSDPALIRRDPCLARRDTRLTSRPTLFAWLARTQTAMDVPSPGLLAVATAPRRPRADSTNSTRGRAATSHSGTVVVRVMSARRLKAADQNGRSDPYCVIKVGAGSADGPRHAQMLRWRGACARGNVRRRWTVWQPDRAHQDGVVHAQPHLGREEGVCAAPRVRPSRCARANDGLLTRPDVRCAGRQAAAPGHSRGVGRGSGRERRLSGRRRGAHRALHPRPAPLFAADART